MPSAKPQLIETTEAFGAEAAVTTAPIKSESDWLLASTRTIWAPGARAWAHSTSSSSSISQLLVPGPLGSAARRLVVCPSWFTTVRNDDAAPYCWKNVGPEDVVPNWESN